MLKMDQLKIQLTKIHPVPYMANCFRLMNLQYLLDGDTPLSGNGFQYSSGRFHTKGSYPIIYLAEEIETTMHETLNFKHMTLDYLKISSILPQSQMRNKETLWYSKKDSSQPHTLKCLILMGSFKKKIIIICKKK